MPASPVLVVDDDLDIRSLVALVLSTEGYQVTTAANGVEALEALPRVQPACVVLDMWMPVLDGPGFARELAARHLHIPVIVMTAAHDAQYWAREVKAAGCLGKPFDLGDLLDTVERLCRHAGPAAS